MGRHSLLWVMLIAFCFLGLPAISTPTDIMNRVVRELTLIEQSLGKAETSKVTKSATAFYNAVFIGTGAEKTSTKFVVSEEEKENTVPLFGNSVRALSSKTNDYVRGFSSLCFAVFVRVAIILSWLPYIAPFLLAAITDAAVTRKIKFESFGYSSPIKFAAAAHSMIVVVFLPLLYLVVPLPITPLFVPFWALISAIPIMLLVANTQRV